MSEYRLTEAGRIGLRMLLDAESLYRADRNGLRLFGMEDVVDLPDAWVEPVPSPLPPQPEPGVYMLGENAEVGQCYVWVYGAGANVTVFYYGGHSGWIPWAEAWELAGGEGVAIRRLVPAPEPVTLPWHSPNLDESGDTLDCEVGTGSGLVYDTNREVHLSGNEVNVVT